jgi:hypothetical protein
MCSAPDAPDVQKIPMRAAAVLPDNGDPAVRNSLRRRTGLSTSAMILANRSGNIGAPATSAPTGTSGL